MARYLLNDREMVCFTVGVTDFSFLSVNFQNGSGAKLPSCLAADDVFFIRY